MDGFFVRSLIFCFVILYTFYFFINNVYYFNNNQKYCSKITHNLQSNKYETDIELKNSLFQDSHFKLVFSKTKHYQLEKIIFKELTGLTFLDYITYDENNFKIHKYNENSYLIIINYKHTFILKEYNNLLFINLKIINDEVLINY